MCLLIVGQFDKLVTTLLKTPELLEDIYTSNADGVGVMYPGNPDQAFVYVNKALPKSGAETRKFFEELLPLGSTQQMAAHFRMRTHGNIDLDQCHPYPIPGSTNAWLMHNGVLRSGNAADVTKSDTWHYAKDVLSPIAQESDGLLHNSAIQHLLASDLGASNKFAILTADGQMSITNRDSGVEHDGLWFSNTYAWSPELLIPGYAPKRLAYYGGYNAEDKGDYWGYYETPVKRTHQVLGATYVDNFITDVLAGNEEQIVDTLYCLEPGETTNALSKLFEECEYTVIESDGPSLLKDKTAAQLALELEPEVLADLLIYKTSWGPREVKPAATSVQTEMQLG